MTLICNVPSFALIALLLSTCRRQTLSFSGSLFLFSYSDFFFFFFFFLVVIVVVRLIPSSSSASMNNTRLSSRNRQQGGEEEGELVLLPAIRPCPDCLSVCRVLHWIGGRMDSPERHKVLPPTFCFRCVDSFPFKSPTVCTRRTLASHRHRQIASAAAATANFNAFSPTGCAHFIVVRRQ